MDGSNIPRSHDVPYASRRSLQCDLTSLVRSSDRTQPPRLALTITEKSWSMSVQERSPKQRKSVACKPVRGNGPYAPPTCHSKVIQGGPECGSGRGRISFLMLQCMSNPVGRFGDLDAIIAHTGSPQKFTDWDYLHRTAALRRALHASIFTQSFGIRWVRLDACSPLT